MSMKRPLAGIKDDCAIEERSDLLDTALHFAIPELQFTAPVLIPAWVQIQNQVEAPLEAQVWVNAVIDVDIEFASRLDAMHSAAVEVVVGLQTFYAGQVGKYLSALHRVEHGECLPYL